MLWSPQEGLRSVMYWLLPLPFILFFHQVKEVSWELQSGRGELESGGKTSSRDVHSALVLTVCRPICYCYYLPKQGIAQKYFKIIFDFPYSRIMSVTEDHFKVPYCVHVTLKTSGSIALLYKRFLLNSVHFQLFKCCREKNSYGEPYKILLTGGRKRNVLPPFILCAEEAG